MSNVTDITKHFSLEFWEFLERSIDNANNRGDSEANIWDFLTVILSNRRIVDLITEENVPVLLDKIANGVKIKNQSKPQVTKVNSEFHKFILYTFLIASKYKRLNVRIEDACLAYLTFPASKDIFKNLNISVSQLSLKIIEKLGGADELSQSATTLTSKFSANLNIEFQTNKIEIVGRENEIGQIVRVFSKQSGKNPILVGEEGVGKKSVVFGFVRELVLGNVPENIRGSEVIQINISAFNNSNGQDRIQSVIDRIIEEAKVNKKIIYIENIHELSSSNSKSEYSYFQFALKTAINSNEVRVIGSTNNSNYRKYLENDSAFGPKLEIIKVNEPSDTDVIKICRIKSNFLEGFHHVSISDEAITGAVELSKRYVTEKFLPSKAIDLIDEASTLNKGQAVSIESIRKILASKTGIPIENLTQDEKAKLIGLEQALAASVKGQNEIIFKVAEVIRRSRAGLKDPKKPVGSFLFLGPSGVGKTELAKALAKAIYDTPKAMVRIDMSEFSESHTVQRLVGAPPGYVGYEEGGQLTNPILERPYSLILLDEIEKAHPKVFDIFLQVLDDGRLTDGQGRTVDFRNTIIIATSNIGSDYILTGKNHDEKFLDLENFGISSEALPTNISRNEGFAKALGINITSKNETSSIQQEKPSIELLIPILKNYFRPEFINRFDEILIFNPLSKSILADILDLQIKVIEMKLKEQGIVIRLKTATREDILNRSYQPQFGARPLLRNIQEKVENFIANEIIKGSIKPNSTVEI